MARLLLVDDEREQTKLWRLCLEKAGHTIETAETGAEAMERLAAFRPDALVMDLRLPELKGGLELIRRAAEHRPMRIVVLSGWPQDLETLPERKLVDRVLVKPVKLGALLAAIGELVLRAAGGR